MITKLKKLKAFNFLEKISLLKFSLGHKMINKTNRGLSDTYLAIQRLEAREFSVQRKGGDIKIDTKIHDQNRSFLLKRKSSDTRVFEQIIADEEYAPIVEVFKEKNSSIRTFIDAGANVGLTSAYIQSFYPDAKTICLEPSNSTMTRLKRNLKLNGINAKCYEKGLWSSVGTLYADRSFRDKQDWSFRLTNVPNSGEKIEVTTINTILRENEIDIIDFLKVDTEGAEKELFEDPKIDEWLKKVKVIAIEIHDEFACRLSIESKLVCSGFKIQHSGELTIGVK